MSMPGSLARPEGSEFLKLGSLDRSKRLDRLGNLTPVDSGSRPIVQAVPGAGPTWPWTKMGTGIPATSNVLLTTPTRVLEDGSVMSVARKEMVKPRASENLGKM